MIFTVTDVAAGAAGAITVIALATLVGALRRLATVLDQVTSCSMM